MTTLFIADLHLSPNAPDMTQAFLSFMSQQAPEADALYILGDLFDFWIGDDDKSDFANTIKTAIYQLTHQHQVPVYFIQGNRDFLLGQRFCQQTGMTLLADEVVIDLYGEQVLIMHGDTLCTDDQAYQSFRAKVHQPWLQWLFNHLPFALRRHIVNKIQRNARDEKHQKSMVIMDVNQRTVEQRLHEQKVQCLIHGHTHRPNVHHFLCGDKHAQRIVLGDWFEQGSYLQVTADHKQLHYFPLLW